MGDAFERAGLLNAPLPEQGATLAEARLMPALKRVMDLLERKLGDTDPNVEGMTQDEIEMSHPVLAAMQIVTGLYTAAPADAGEAAAREYPDSMTDDLRHVLGFPNFRCGPYAHLMRAAGADIQRQAEDEQAHVLHWLVKLVIDHGERWADVAEEEMNAMRAKVAVRSPTTRNGEAPQ